MCKPKMFVAYTWITIVVLLFIYGICAIALAVENDSGDDSDNKAIGFAGIFTMILSFALAVGGTLVMRKYQTELAVGFFLGVVIMMAFNFLTLTALLAYEYNECDDANHRVQSGTADCYFQGCASVPVPDASCFETTPAGCTLGQTIPDGCVVCTDDENTVPAGCVPAEDCTVCANTVGWTGSADSTCFDSSFHNCCNAFLPLVDTSGVESGAVLDIKSTTYGFFQPQAQNEFCITCSEGNCDANLAGAVFSCFLFVAYAIFGAILAIYKDEIVVKKAADDTEDAAAEPPSMN